MITLRNYVNGLCWQRLQLNILCGEMSDDTNFGCMLLSQYLPEYESEHEELKKLLIPSRTSS